MFFFSQKIHNIKKAAPHDAEQPFFLPFVFHFQDLSHEHPVGIPVLIDAVTDLIRQTFPLKLPLIEFSADEGQLGFLEGDAPASSLGVRPAADTLSSSRPEWDPRYPRAFRYSGGKNCTVKVSLSVRISQV